MCNPIWNAWECISAVYLLQLILIGAGLILGIIGLISRDIASILSDQKPFLKIKDFEFNPQIPRKVRLWMQYGGAFMLAMGIIWVVIAEISSPLVIKMNAGTTALDPSTTPVSISGVSLVGMKYLSGGWNPHMVDLRTASTSGIPAGATFPLKFSEITVFAPPELAGSQVWAEFLANGTEKIGETKSVILQDGLTPLDMVMAADSYQYVDRNTNKHLTDTWDVLKSWTSIDVLLKYKNQAGQEGSTRWTIKLNQMGGTAWWNAPPDVNLVSIVYSVNDGVQQVLDLRREPNPVIHAKAGGWVTIHSIWYKANSGVNNQNMVIGASINDGLAESEHKTSEKVVIREGTHRFENFEGMTAISTAKVAVTVDKVLQTSGVTPALDTVTFTAAPAAGDVVVIKVEHL